MINDLFVFVYSACFIFHGISYILALFFQRLSTCSIIPWPSTRSIFAWHFSYSSCFSRRSYIVAVQQLATASTSFLAFSFASLTLRSSLHRGPYLVTTYSIGLREMLTNPTSVYAHPAPMARIMGSMTAEPPAAIRHRVRLFAADAVDGELG